MDLQQLADKAGQHPYVTGAIVFGVGLGALWWLGYIGGGSSASSSASSGASNLAGAYYSAEAAQTQAGAAVQIATLQAQAQTSQANAYTGAAVAIAQANDNTQAQLAASGAQTSDTAAMYAYKTATDQAYYQSATAAVQANTSAAISAQQGRDALATAQVTNAYAAQIAKSQSDATEFASFIGSNVPGELINRYGVASATLPNGQGFFASGPLPVPGTPTYYEAVGYTPDQALVLASHTVAGQFNPSLA